MKIKFLFFLVFFGLSIFGREVPELRGRVNDYAGIISSETAFNIEKILAELEASDSTQVAVLTVKSLEGDSLEDFSIKVAEKWKIGQKGLDNGVILIVALEERKIRIEVGYGLEGRLTDAISARIIRNIIAPEFKKEDFSAGIEEGVKAISAAVKGEFKAYEKKKDKAGIIILIMFILFVFISMFGKSRGKYNHTYFSGGSGFGGFGSGGFGGGFRGGGGGFGGGGSSGGW